jgi:hypothetical protein
MTFSQDIAGILLSWRKTTINQSINFVRRIEEIFLELWPFIRGIWFVNRKPSLIQEC